MLPRRLLTPVCLVVYDDDDEYDDDGRDVLDGVVAGFLAQGFLFHDMVCGLPNRRPAERLHVFGALHPPFRCVPG